VSQGYSCPKGLARHEVTHDPDRIVHPMKRTASAGSASRGSSDRRDRAKLNAIRAAHGPDAIALYTGNPSGYAYAHRIYSANWIKALGSRNSYGAGSQDNLADFLAARFLYGASFRQPVPDVDRAKYLLVRRHEPARLAGDDGPPGRREGALQGGRRAGGKIVVIDPRRSETARIAQEHHFIRPAPTPFLLLAMIRRSSRKASRIASLLATQRERRRVARRRSSRRSRRSARPSDGHRRRHDPPPGARDSRRAGACAFGRAGLRPVRHAPGVGARRAERRRPATSIARAATFLRRPRRSREDRAAARPRRLRRASEPRANLPGVLGELPAASSPTRSRRRGPGRSARSSSTAGNPVVVDRERHGARRGHARARVHGRDRHLHERDGGAGDYVLPRRRGSSARTSRSST
jgi:formate dehydrogenase